VPVDEQVRKTLRVPAELPPVAKLLGMDLASVGAGIATFTLVADERHHNPMGSVHGGILADLADAAMGFAVISTLAKDETFTTVEMKVDFIRPVFSGKLRCLARVVNRGRTLAFAEAEIENKEWKIVAKATSTNMVLKRAGDADPFHHRLRHREGHDG